MVGQAEGHDRVGGGKRMPNSTKVSGWLASAKAHPCLPDQQIPIFAQICCMHSPFRTTFLTVFVFLSAFLIGKAQDIHPSIVYVEGYDAEDNRLSLGLGVVIKEGFVAVNYHIVAGMASVGVFEQDKPQKIISEGYLSVEEATDMIVIAAPGVEAQPIQLNILSFPKDGSEVTTFINPDSRRVKPVTSKVGGSKELLEEYLPQLLSRQGDHSTSGPIIKDEKLMGFLTAGYLDDQHYAYGIPAYELNKLLNRSFIIKSFNSLNDTEPIGTSYFQKSLMESLTAVLWQSLPDAERLARKSGKMVIIDVSSEWSGWSKLMHKNTYSSKKIIRYLNENYYTVRFNAESDEPVNFNKLTYQGAQTGSFHTLAYSLLEGEMEFPSTVILDEELSVIMVIPGYMDTRKMEVVLHYFSEKAYLKKTQTYQEYEQEFLAKNK